MDHLLALLREAFDPKPLMGWVLALFGTIMILLVRYQILPEKGEIPGLYTIAMGCAVLGWVILAVRLGMFFVGSIQSSREEAAEQRSSAAKSDEVIAEGLRNLAVLDNDERIKLHHLLRSGSPRFSGYDGSFAFEGLCDKYVILPDPTTQAQYVYVVNPKVWEIREKIISHNLRPYIGL